MTTKRPQHFLLDTNIALPMLLPTSLPGQERSHQQAVEIRDWSRDNDARLCVPAPVLAELLVGFPIEKSDEAAADIVGRFTIVSFGTREAVVAGKYAAKLTAAPDVKLRDVAQEVGVSRKCLKADLMILATAGTWRMPLVTSDGPMLKIAKRLNLGGLVISGEDFLMGRQISLRLVGDP